MTETEIHGDTPKVRLTGTETNGIGANIKEDAGDVVIRDEANATDLVRLTGNTPLNIDIPIPVIFEVAKTGLKADSTGVKFTSRRVIPTISEYATLSIEATWTASHTDSETAVEIYDRTTSSVIASVSGNDGAAEKSAYVNFTSGHPLVVRVNVTKASATSGATTDVDKAVIYQRITLS